MDVDMIFFQELAFTVALSVLVYLILCKFHSNIHQERGDFSMGFCEKSVLCEQFDTASSIVDHRGVEDEGVMRSGDEEIADKVFDESPVRRINEIEVEGPLGDEFREIEIEHGEIEEFGEVEEDEIIEEEARDEMENEALQEGVEEVDEEGLSDDDWEGIERTELEKVFDAAVVFVDLKGNADQLDNDVKMQLYGLHKVATNGPCCIAQPSALKLSARAKWNAWQRVGDISREDAMEQYIALLSRKFTDWKDEQ